MKHKVISWLVFIVVAILSVFFPVPSILISFIGVIVTAGALRKCYALLVAVSLAIVAYIWNPSASMDLFRYHVEIKTLFNASHQKLFSIIAHNLEPAHYYIEYLVAQARNVNLLQFVVVLLGYFELFWMICDYSDIKKAKRSTFAIMLVYAISAVSFINYASGLWCNFAIINLALAIYFQYFKKTKRIQYLFYIFAAFLHTGTIYMLLLALLFSKVRFFRKTRLSAICILSVAIFCIGGIIAIINNLFGSEAAVVSIINKMYDGYFTNGSQFSSLHTGWNLYLPVASVLFGLILLIPRKTKETLREYRSFMIYLSVCFLATIIHAGVFIRFSFLIAMLLTPVLYEYLEGNMKEKRLTLSIAVVALLLSVAQLSRSYMQASDAGLINDARECMAENSIRIVERSSDDCK